MAGRAGATDVQTGACLIELRQHRGASPALVPSRLPRLSCSFFVSRTCMISRYRRQRGKTLAEESLTAYCAGSLRTLVRWRQAASAASSPHRMSRRGAGETSPPNAGSIIGVRKVEQHRSLRAIRCALTIVAGLARRRATTYDIRLRRHALCAGEREHWHASGR